MPTTTSNRTTDSFIKPTIALQRISAHRAGLLENLESRRLLNGATAFGSAVLDPASGIVTVTGTDDADTIRFEYVRQERARELRIEIDGSSTWFPISVIKGLNVDAKDGNDLVILGRRDVPATLAGGAGDDSLSSGNGNDILMGGPGNDYLFGRDGADTVAGGSGSDLIAGGDGTDIADYSTRTRPVTVGVGRLYDDGEAGEHDNVREDIEIVRGGKGNDFLTTIYTKPVTLEGGPGNDTLQGLSGSDTLAGNDGQDTILHPDTNPIVR